MMDRTRISVLSRIARLLECEEVECATLDSLGVDSFRLVQLVLDLESAFGVPFDEDVLDAAFQMTLGQLARYVERRITHGPD